MLVSKTAGWQVPPCGYLIKLLPVAARKGHVHRMNLPAGRLDRWRIRPEANLAAGRTPFGYNPLIEPPEGL